MVSRLKGNKIELAPTARIDELQVVADEFMFEIFDLMPGEYLITDESSLRDFTDVDSRDTAPIWGRIEARYAIELFDVPSESLANILVEINSRRRLQ